ncbi:MAG: DUF1573 domain-containing protein [Bacteroidia bacterium]
MKKIAIALLAVLLAVGMTSCDKSNSPEGGDEAAPATDATAATNPAATPATTPPPEPQKPGYQEKAENMAASTASWNTEEYNWGKVTDGEIVRHTFTFTNNGSEPLQIQNARASCGCTTPAYSKEPIAPGESGEIQVEFNSKGRVGLQNKTVTVTGNFEGGINKTLRIKGEVAAAEGGK